MEILMLNVRGLKSTIKTNPDKKNQFIEVVLNKKAHILCLVETLTNEDINGYHEEDQEAVMPEYELVAWRAGRRSSDKQGPSSGGLAIYRRRDASNISVSTDNSCDVFEANRGCTEGCSLLCSHNPYVLIVTVNKEFKLCLVYLPPPSDRMSLVLKDVLKNVLKNGDDKVILVGDFNAHTGTSSVDWPERQRKSFDGENYNRGEQLMEFLQEKSLVVLNGRAEPDYSEGGKNTYQVDNADERSVIDYAIVHKNLFENFKFRVLEISFVFDHRPIVVSKYSLLERYKKELRKVSFGDLSDLQLKDIAAAYTESEIKEAMKATKHRDGLRADTTNMTAAHRSVKSIVKALQDEYQQEEKLVEGVVNLHLQDDEEETND